MTGKKSHIARAMKNATEPTDQKRVFQFKKDFEGATGLPFITWSTIPGINRNPDGITEIYGFKVPLEHDGAHHGFGDDVSESKQTRSRNDDYMRGGVIPIIVNTEWLKLNKIAQATYLKCVTFNHEQYLRSARRVLNATVQGDMPKIQGKEAHKGR